ncbi:hypothetical protein CASFOL_032416 [Castilleja foliolosa]|uniref:tRNA (guanine-N(7)-)-methyltransferase non-catalytic subunit n=1 Tax=Castilleja foliolosa TaxID=1961234 RepID=A0ABD3C1E3_9LAMI
MAGLGVGRRSTPSTAWMVHQDWIRRRRVMLGVTKSIIDGEGSSRQRDKVVVACRAPTIRRSSRWCLVVERTGATVIDGSGVKLLDDNGGHKDSIRAVGYSKSGKLFVSAGDDKLVKVWDTKHWRCFCSVASEKKVTSVAIGIDEKFVCFADKFGVVYVVDIRDYDYENPALINKKAVPILSHYCSIITRLEFSPDGQYIVTADRDFKIRVTVFPKEPLNGVHEIQSFCLGHTEFVSCLAFVSNQDYPQGLLLSGSGDSTVRLWEYTSGSLLDTCDVGSKVNWRPSDPFKCLFRSVSRRRATEVHGVYQFLCDSNYIAEDFVSMECLNICKLWKGDLSGKYDCNMLSCALKAPRVLTGFLASTAHPPQSYGCRARRNSIGCMQLLERICYPNLIRYGDRERLAVGDEANSGGRWGLAAIGWGCGLGNCA